jgi:hypothetical protein
LQIASDVWNHFTILLVAVGSMWLGFAFGLKTLLSQQLVSWKQDTCNLRL